MNKIIKIILFISLSILTFPFSSCEEDNEDPITIVKGTVSDSQTNELINGYTIRIYEDLPDYINRWSGDPITNSKIIESVITNAQGEFFYEFEAKEEPKYYIRSIENVDYSGISNTTINANKINSYDFKVDPVED